ncbi:MAG: vWA domain-containing protein [Egibacteraceae bacterium]
MRFAVPWGFAVVGLTLPLVLWYVLRSRRPRVEVASTFLWRSTDRAVAAAVPWQRFRPDRTFWLVLAALLVGIVALARPALPVTAALGDHTILVLDASASMLADEGGPTRLELARREAQRLVERAGPAQLLSVVEAGPRGRVLLSASDDQVAASRALRSIQAAQAPADLADALTLAASLQRPNQETVTHLFTDGVVPAEAAPLAPAGLIVNALGQDRPNLAVAHLQAVPAGGGAATAFVQVRNFGLLGTDARLVLDVIEGDTTVPVADRRVTLAPRGAADLVVPVDHRPAENALLRARVEPVGVDVTGADQADALSLDDQAWAALSGPREVQALVAGPENVFLAAALGSVPGVEVTSAYGVPEDLTGIDLLVVDRIAAPPQPRVPTIYVAPAAPPEGITVAGELELPALTFQDPDHGLMADVDLSGVAIAKAQALQAPALRAVASGPSGPLLLAGRLGPTPVVYVGFDLLQSNLPLQVAWPVLTANAVAWLTGPPASAPAIAGAQTVLTPPAGITGIQVTPPGGPATRLDLAWPQLVADRVGVWTVEYDAPPEVLEALALPAPLVVNADPADSDLSRPRPGPDTPTDTARVAGTTAPQAPSNGLRVFGREILVGVLVLLLLEWASTHGVRPLRWWRGRRARRIERAVQR